MEEATIPQMQALTEALKDTTQFEVAHDAGGGNYVSRRASAAQIATHAAAAVAGRTAIERALQATDLVPVALDQGNSQFTARKATVRDIADFAALDGVGRFVPFLSDLSRPPAEMAGLVGYTLTGMPGVTALQFDRLVTAPGGLRIDRCAQLLGLQFPVLESALQFQLLNCSILTGFSAPRLQTMDSGKEIRVQGNPELLAVEFPALENWGPYGSFTILDNAKLTGIFAPFLTAVTVDFEMLPALTQVDLSSLHEGSVMISSAGFTELSLPAYTNGSVQLADLGQLQALLLPAWVEGDFTLYGPTQLTCLEFPELTTLDWGLQCQDNALLTDVSLPKLASAGSSIDFSGCALTAASVNNILARLVADPNFGMDENMGMPKSANLSGGTNAAPTGQGLVDKATLIARGASITTN